MGSRSCVRVPERPGTLMTIRYNESNEAPRPARGGAILAAIAGPASRLLYWTLK